MAAVGTRHSGRGRCEERGTNNGLSNRIGSAAWPSSVSVIGGCRLRGGGIDNAGIGATATEAAGGTETGAAETGAAAGAATRAATVPAAGAAAAAGQRAATSADVFTVAQGLWQGPGNEQQAGLCADEGRASGKRHARRYRAAI